MSQLSKIGLILIGPPGIGKGTFGIALSKVLGFPHLSSSQLLTNFNNMTNDIRDTIKSGALVDDKTVNTLFESALVDDQYKNGVILDGYPRTIDQANFMHHKFEKIICIHLLLDESILLQRLTGRLVCQDCKKCYNSCDIHNEKYKMSRLMPTEEDLQKCKGCNNLKTRPDDKPDVVKNRVDVYMKSTAPLIKFYSDKGLIEDFEIREGLGDLPRLVERIKSLI
ncbi:adenylate kinase [Babesia microti strain RI]|uniref:Adenylate kinase n=1 Tax=Babesia microti (strain RI) TaxID=1133968 RepID=A0A1R4AB74_BABMR|nr:adenylate kinase [Babesia microti strain RI]SJK86258.1 adenylate kinase [Babesia microti strain RI]|eukprot:XP_021338439.1 adenylate kinase [Babesia microti strain RI]